LRGAKAEREKSKNKPKKHFAEQREYSDEYFNSLITKVGK